jgi:hypothetical protein
MRRLLCYLWTAPVTLPALAIGYFCVAFGGTRSHKQEGVWEFYGGVMARVLDLIGLPGIGGMPAMTLGHVIWARNRRELRKWRRHEFVHVAQFERWGVFVIPAFYLAAAWLVLRGRHPYYDNPIEREAYGKVAFPHAVEGLPRPAETRPQVVAPIGLEEGLLKPQLLAMRPAPAPRA